MAAASDLQAALPAIAAAFEKATGQKVTLTFGSSGNFFTQIQNGAPFDVFLSADIDYPRQLERGGLAERGSFYEYATGHIVLWTRNDSGIDVRRGLAVLTDPRSVTSPSPTLNTRRTAVPLSPPSAHEKSLRSSARPVGSR